MERKFNEQELIKRNKLKTLIEQEYDPFKITNFKRTHNSNSFKKEFGEFSKEELHSNTSNIVLAGRVMSIRQTFGGVQDYFGKFQFYINKKNHPELFSFFSKHVDLGDILGLEGTPMKTNTGELTLNVNKMLILSKSLKPLPEKWHGLKDEELRARRRYLDLIINDETKQVLSTRSAILFELRNYMNSLEYIEVETPVLQPILGGASARPFITHHNTLDRNFYLRVAPELALKKIIVGGFEKVYEIGRVFRNEGMDTTHNPEFTSLESYEAYASMWDIMELTEKIFRHIAAKLNKLTITYKGTTIDFTKPFIRIDIVEFIKNKTNIDFKNVNSDKEAIKLADEHKIELLPHQMNRGHILNAFFEKYCEKDCLQPTFVFGHPIEVSPLAKKSETDPRHVERFELFICGKEYANAYSELNDPIDQYERFKEQTKEKEMGNNEANEMDMDFIEALEYGLPPTGGLGIGIDRLVMLFTNQESIREVLFFPHMKDEN